MKLTLFHILFILLFISAFQNDNYKAALKLNNNKQFEASIDLCTNELHKLNSKDTLYTKFLSLRADNYRELRNFKSGIKDYQTLIKLHPNETLYYVDLSYFYGEEGEYTNCLSILKDGMKIDSKNIYILNNLSYYSNQVGNFGDGVSYANIAFPLTSDPIWMASLLNNRGYSNLGLKKYTQALKDINEAIKLNPDNSFAYCYRAMVNIEIKNLKTVCSDLNKAKSLGAVNLTMELINQYCKKK
jgi:tetratricopeptide (TPR) repeat protein